MTIVFNDNARVKNSRAGITESMMYGVRKLIVIRHYSYEKNEKILAKSIEDGIKKENSHIREICTRIPFYHCTL